jgi:hypothetical protein
LAITVVRGVFIEADQEEESKMNAEMKGSFLVVISENEGDATS